ncbi:hypothetical protein MNBD_GAMMA10-2927 [hydrothermal vent metagenome]|uniref:DUF302 domain-containing protein n=1 Tax=hydrothermal vent metagenome TaxID=652676 RepID=A0A3B0XYW3_9ZZZZ
MLKQITRFSFGAFSGGAFSAGAFFGGIFSGSALRGISLAAFMLTGSAIEAGQSTIYKQTVDAPMDKVYPAVYKTLEEAKFFVVFEPKISKMLSRFSKKWGDNYNQSKLSSIRSMVFCNGWYANAVSNVDPDMLALCPLRIGLYEKQGKTTIVFVRPTVAGAQSAAKSVLKEVEDDVIKAIKAGIEGTKG